MSVKLFIAGDYVNTGTPDFLCEDLRALIQTHDLAICNFEAPVCVKGATSIPKAGPALCQAQNSPRWLADAGFQFCTFANNHIYDFGDIGLHRTMENFAQCGLGFIGAGLNFEQAYQVQIQSINGLSLAFINAGEAQAGVLKDEKSTQGGYAWIYHPKIDQLAQQLRSSADFIILVAHAGLEDSPLPQPEWRRRFHQLCDHGIDIIVGHHPHVPQGIEYYSNSLIIYSLGNFFFDTCGFELSENYSFSVSLQLEAGKMPKFIKYAHRQFNGKTSLVDDSHFLSYLEILDDLLDTDKYYSLAIQQSTYACHEFIYRYYTNSVLGCTFETSLLKRIFNALCQLFYCRYKQNYREKLLWHSVMNESLSSALEAALAYKVAHGEYPAFDEYQACLLEMKKFC